VVPPSLLLARRLGDCEIVRSLPAIVMSSVVAFGSTIPRSREGRGWEKRRKDSGEGSGYGLGWVGLMWVGKRVREIVQIDTFIGVLNFLAEGCEGSGRGHHTGGGEGGRVV